MGLLLSGLSAESKKEINLCVLCVSAVNHFENSKNKDLKFVENSIGLD